MMIQILTRDTVPPDQFADYVAHDWSGTEHLAAGWSVAFGPVTQILFLQEQAGVSIPSLPEGPAEFRRERRHRQWLAPAKMFRKPPPEMRFLEMRAYDVRTGQGDAFLRRMLEALPLREQYSPNCGVWTSLSGRSERVLHLWGYRDLEERDGVRAKLRGDSGWSDYTRTILPMLEVLNSTILAPLPLA